MSRKEENREVRRNTKDETFNSAIKHILLDISKSLAVIADAMDKESE